MVPTDKTVTGVLDFYAGLFADRRDEPLTIIEFGVLHGGSLIALAELFPLAIIIGVDADAPAAEFMATKPDRVRFIRGNCTDATLLHSLPSADIIIDDASHFYKQARLTYLSTWCARLNPNGWYCIEDWQAGYRNAAKYGIDGGLRRLLFECLDTMQAGSQYAADRIILHNRTFCMHKGAL
ncbi:MAG: class I SAM-dependent methyltransferase [Candidatus Atribacteria bacterium]|nr:class I SAM-dependent methyltransferase [Candidatus Atribacteria bacterium]